MPVRPVTHRMDAVEFTPWVLANRYSNSFGIGFGVKLSDGATLTYYVQHTFDDLYEVYKNLTIARVTTTATVTQVAHGLSVGDWAKITNAGDANLNGEYSVASVVDVDNFTYTVADTGAAAAGGNVGLQKARVFNHSAVENETTSQDGNYEFPPRAIRANCTAWTDGQADFTVIQAGR